MADYRLRGPTDAWQQSQRIDNGSLCRQAAAGRGPTDGAQAGHASEWDPRVLMRRAQAVQQALEIARERTPQAIVRATGLDDLPRLAHAVITGMLEMALVVAATSALGGVAGAAIGAVFGGVGAAPGAAVGAQLGFDAGMALMAWLGLALIATEVVRGLGEVTQRLRQGVVTAWDAEDAADRQHQIAQAGQTLADAMGQLMLVVLMAIVARLAASQAVAATGRATGGATEVFTALRSSRLGGEFATWVEVHAADLLRNPRLRPHAQTAGSSARGSQASTPSQLKGPGKASPAQPPAADGGSPRQTARSRPPSPLPENRADLKAQFGDDIRSASTFKAKGLSTAASERYLESSQGQQLLAELRAADPTAGADKIYSRAMDQLATGVAEPRLADAATSLYKIVPRGEAVSTHSPFFTTAEGLEAAKASGKGLAEQFGLPIKSESALYDIYEIVPQHPAKVFVSEVAPTSELGGLVQQSGGAMQVVVPNRGAFSTPKLVGSIAN